MIKKIDAKFLATLKPGQVFQTEGVFLGVTDAPLDWKLVEGSEAEGYIFELSYMGAVLGQYAVLVEGGTLVVEELETA